MLQLVNGCVGIAFVMATIAELMNSQHRRPVQIHVLAVATTLVVSIMNLSSLAANHLGIVALMLTVGILLSYIGFLLAEARIWTLDAECGCFGRTAASIRSAIVRNAACATALAAIVVVHRGWPLPLVLVAVMGCAVGWLVAMILGPTRLLTIRSGSSHVDQSATSLRLLALDSRCPECVHLARALSDGRLTLRIDGVLTDHMMRVAVPDNIPRYRLADPMSLVRLPTPCLVTVRQDGAVTRIERTEAAADVYNSHQYPLD